MSINSTKNKNVLDFFSKILESLSEKERSVIERRIWLNWERETLQSIWNSFFPPITRERIRQLEDTWIKKIWRIVKTTDLNNIHRIAEEILKEHWWLLVKEKLINATIKSLWLEENINNNIIEVIIQSDYELLKSKPKLGVLTYFHLPGISKKSLDVIHKEAVSILKKKKDIMKTEVLYNMIKSNIDKDFPNISIPFVDSVLDIYQDIIKWEGVFIWLEKWKILNPKTLKDKAIYVMRKEKIPMHFIEISNKITTYLWDKVKVSTIHNELIRNNEFVLIWRWIYALKDWWFTPWTVIDVIADILQKNGEAMSTEEIVNEVLKTRNVKKTTIYMNLQNKNVIDRVWRNYYQLKK